MWHGVEMTVTCRLLTEGALQTCLRKGESLPLEGSKFLHSYGQGTESAFQMRSPCASIEPQYALKQSTCVQKYGFMSLIGLHRSVQFILG